MFHLYKSCDLPYPKHAPRNSCQEADMLELKGFTLLGSTGELASFILANWFSLHYNTYKMGWNNLRQVMKTAKINADKYLFVYRRGYARCARKYLSCTTWFGYEAWTLVYVITTELPQYWEFNQQCAYIYIMLVIFRLTVFLHFVVSFFVPDLTVIHPLVQRKPKMPCPSPSPTLISNGIPLFNSETSRIYRWCLGIVISMLG